MKVASTPGGTMLLSTGKDGKIRKNDEGIPLIRKSAFYTFIRLMYLMYVDESGDPGRVNSPTNFYILSAVVLHESYWLSFLNEAIEFRRELKRTKGLLMKEEIHAADFVTKRIKLASGISRNERMDILKKCIQWLGKRPYISIITVKVNKAIHPDPFEAAWRYLIQRFENTLEHQNFPNPAFKYDLGIIVADNTDGPKLTKLLRQMRRINYIPSKFQGSSPRNMPLQYIIKDPVLRESANSYIVQFVDVVAYFAKQYFEPNKYIRQKAAKNYYGVLQPVINQKVTYSMKDFKILQI